jgi:hypothetical protein
LERLHFDSPHVLEFDISSILRFRNLKSICLDTFAIQKIQSAPFAKLSRLALYKIQIDADSLDLIFIHSRFIIELILHEITTNGNLNFNTSFQNLNRIKIYGLNSINFNRIFKAIRGSTNTLVALYVRFPTREEIDSNVEILQRLTKLKDFICFDCSKVQVRN